MSSKAELIYFDVTVSNLNNTNTQPPILYFNENRSIPFINNPEEYKMSIIRFTIDTSNSIPVFLPLIQPNQNNRNLTIYSVTLSYGGFNYQQYITFQPQDLSASIPSPPSSNLNGVQDNSTGYYNVYSYQWWINLVDMALANAFLGLSGLVGAGFPSTTPPRLVWDINSNCAVLYSPYQYYNSYSTPNQISIFMNSSLFQLFNSFPSQVQNYPTVVFGKNFQILTTFLTEPPIQDFPQNNPAAELCIETFQECSTIANWSPVLSICYTTSTLPVVAENVSSPQIYINGILQQAYSGNNANIANIITDLVADNNTYQPWLIYSPSAQYRYVELYGKQPLSNFDFTILYKLRTGELIPMRLQAGGSSTLKILFEKKPIYKGN